MFQPKAMPVGRQAKQCQSCKTDFTIEPEDFEFYQKISVPEPTFCPLCRAQRRFVCRNVVELYKRKCDFSGKELISIYRPGSPYKVYEAKIWNSDKWDPMDYGRAYDFGRPFFEQFKDLNLAVPRAHNLIIDSVNCDYCALIYHCKNCYLCSGNRSEDCGYSIMGGCKNCFDGFWIFKDENCYEDSFCDQSYNLYFSQHSDNCMDSAFLYDCRNCQNCFGCVNLRHKKYHIFNQPYGKEEYQKEMDKYYLGSYANLEKIKKEFAEFRLGFPRRYARVHNADNVTGDDIKNTKNCQYCFFTLEGVEDCKYIWCGGVGLKDSYDIFDGGTKSALSYEGVSVGDNLQRVYFSINVLNGVYDIQYSDTCFSSSYLFACVGLRHKQYCILNKQYTKESFDKLRAKIIQHMDEMPYIDKKGRIYKYGEFFPPEFSYFGYNKTFAQELIPLTEEQALQQGFSWSEKPEMKYQPTIKADELPDDIKEADGAILKELIECRNAPADCAGSGVFRLVPQELEFCQKHHLALPRMCPNCRYQARLKYRNPFALYHRRCMKAGCANEFETAYALDRSEIVYCEECYQKEVE